MGVFTSAFGDFHSGVNVNYIIVGLQFWDKVNLSEIVTPLGTLIPSVTTTAWGNSETIYTAAYAAQSGSAEVKDYAACLAAAMWKYYNNDVSNIDYGIFINHYAVKLIQMDIDKFNILNKNNTCKKRVPDDLDLTKLMTYLGGSAVAGGKLKEAGTVHWKTPNTGATNESKLSIPGSGLAGIDGATTQLTEHATLWALNNVGNTAIRYYLSNVASSFNRQAGLLRKYGMSLRMIFTQNKVVGDTIILGDSTITSFGNEGSVAEHLGVVGTLTDLSTSGETIDQQKTRYNALSSGVKTGAKYIFIEIGLNDPQAYTIAQVMARYQVMINDIKAGSPQAIIIAATLTPCRGQRGSGYDFILLMDEAIKGYGANAITGIDRVATYHTKWIGDAVGNLLTEFTIDPAVDKIHENRAGRMLIAKSWLSKV